MRSHSEQLYQISDVWRQEAELLRTSGDGVEVSDRIFDDGFDVGERSGEFTQALS